MSKLGKIVRTLIFLVMTAALIASTAWGATPAGTCKLVTFQLQGEIFEGQAANLTELVRVAKLAGITELTIKINSPGGDADEGLRLYSAIRGSGMHTTCIAGEEVASAAFLAFQACERRLVTATSHLMTHRVYGVVASPIITPELAQRMSVELTGIAAQMDAAIASRLGMPLSLYLEKVANGNAWEMTGLEAVVANAADAVILTVKPPNKQAKTTTHATVTAQ